MKGNHSGGIVTVTGLLLAAAGAYAMWTGWDLILLERGWSLFIAGSVFLSGGVVTMALGRVVAHLARLGAGAGLSIPAAPAASAEAPAHAQPQAQSRVHAPAKQDEPRSDHSERPDFASMIDIASPAEEPVEVDRYTAGDATYVMMSDGSVEVRSAAGMQRYPSLAALRAEAESRQP